MSELLDALLREEELKEEARKIRLANRERYLAQVKRWRQEKDADFSRITGPLTQPRKEYVDVATAAQLAWTEKRTINQAMFRKELPFEQPELRKRYILRTEFRAWLDEREKREAEKSKPGKSKARNR